MDNSVHKSLNKPPASIPFSSANKSERKEKRKRGRGRKREEERGREAECQREGHAKTGAKNMS